MSTNRLADMLNESTVTVAIASTAPDASAFVQEIIQTSDDTQVQFAAPTEVLEEIEEGFLASQLQERIDDGYISVRANDAISSTIASSSETEALVSISPTEDVYLTTVSGDDARGVNTAANELFAGGSVYELDASSLSDIRSVAENLENDEFVSELTRALEKSESFDITSPTALVLLGAMHGEEYRDIATVGSESGIASSATFSRRKKELEEAGLITVDTISQDVGRPRHQLHLADDSDASLSSVYSNAEEVLNSQ